MSINHEWEGVALMARSYANVATAIWRDDEFRALSMAAQHAYLLLISQPDISAAGVLSLSLTRWASRTKDATRTDIRDAIDELEAHHFVEVDDETEELLVRSFVRWDGGYGNSKRRFSIRDAAAHIESPALRRVLAAEFGRLDLPEEWIPEFSQVDSPSDASSHSPSDSPSDAVSASRRVVGTKGEYLGPQPTTTNPHTTTLVPSRTASAIPAEPSSETKPAQKRGTRIPNDFTVTPEMVVWARENTPGVDGRYETAKFIDYWHGKSGKDATKVNWISTWRNWMRTAAERGGNGPPGTALATTQPSTTDRRVAAALDLAAKYAEEDQP